MDTVQIPAAWVVTGYGVPRVCPRHGEPATPRAATPRPTIIASRIRPWAYLLLFSPLIFLIVVLVTRKTVCTTNWPLCPQCHSQHARCRTISITAFVLGGLMFPAGIAWCDADLDPSPAAIALLAFSVVVLISGLVVMAFGRPQAISRAFATRDGRWVVVRTPRPAFAMQAQAALVAAQQQQFQQGYQPVQRHPGH